MQLKACATFTSRSEATARNFLYRYTYPIKSFGAIKIVLRSNTLKKLYYIEYFKTNSCFICFVIHSFNKVSMFNKLLCYMGLNEKRNF